MESENDFSDTAGIEKVCVTMLGPDDIGCHVAIRIENESGVIDETDTLTGALDSYTIGARYTDDGERVGGVEASLCILVDNADVEHPTGGVQPYALDIDEWFMIQRDGEPTLATGNHE